MEPFLHYPFPGCYVCRNGQYFGLLNHLCLHETGATGFTGNYYRPDRELQDVPETDLIVDPVDEIHLFSG